MLCSTYHEIHGTRADGYRNSATVQVAVVTIYLYSILAVRYLFDI